MTHRRGTMAESILRPRPLERYLVHPLISAVYRLICQVCSRVGDDAAIAFARRAIQLMLLPFRGIRLRTMAAFFASENAKAMDCVHTDEAYLDYQARLLVENVRLLSISPDEFRKRVRIEGEDCLQNALRKGRGVILLFSHVGNWLLAPCMLSLLGHRVAGIAYEIPIRSVEQHMKRIWARYSITTSHVGRESVRAAKRALDRQSILLMAFDASVRPSRSRWMSFGEGALLADPGPARLTSLLNVPTLRVRVQPEAAMKNLVTIEPVPPHDTDMMTSWLNTLHQEVSRNPHLWWPWSVVKLADRSLVPREAGVVLEQASIQS